MRPFTSITLASEDHTTHLGAQHLSQSQSEAASGQTPHITARSVTGVLAALEHRNETVRNNNDGTRKPHAASSAARKQIKTPSAPSVSPKPGEPPPPIDGGPGLPGNNADDERFPVDLHALAEIDAAQVDVRAARTLPEVIAAALAPQARRIAESGYSAPRPRNGRDIAAALQAGEALIPFRFAIPRIHSWMGEIDLMRLNDWHRYLEHSNADAMLMRDLWIAHTLGLIPLDLAPAGHFNNPIAIHELVGSEFKRAGKPFSRPHLTWHDRLSIDYWSAKHPADATLSPKQNFLAFAQTLCDNGVIGTTSLTFLLGAVETSIARRHKWTRIPLQLDEALLYREIVSSLAARCKAGDDEALQYRGDGGQIRLARQLSDDKRVTTKNLGFLFTALEREWAKVLEWTKIDQSIDDAHSFRTAVEQLREQIRAKEPEALGYRGDSGQVQFVKKLKQDERITSTNLSSLYSALDRDWLEELGWSKIGLSVDEAVRFREAVSQLLAKLDENDNVAQSCCADAGQIRFVQALREQKTIKSGHLAALYSALDRDWLSRLGWTRLSLALDQAIHCRNAVRKLVDGCAAGDAQALQFRGDSGQIRFMQRLYDEGHVTSTSLARIASVLDEQWRAALGWTVVNLSIGDAIAYRSIVENLVERVEARDDEARAYLGNAGQLRLVEKLRREGTIDAQSLAQLSSALNDEWRTTLGWTRISMALDSAIAFRAAVSELATRASNGERRALSYRGDAGQIKFALELRSKKALPSDSFAALNTALDKEWCAVLEWTPLRLPLDTAVMFRDLVAALVERVADGDIASRSYMGDDGQIRFVSDLQTSHSLKSTYLASLWGALDRNWIEALGWSRVELSLDDAGQIRLAVGELVSRCVESKRDALAFKGSVGQIRFMQKLHTEGRISSTRPSHLRTALDPDWLAVLEWTHINLNLADADSWRNAVEALIRDLHAEAEQDGLLARLYTGNAGQLRFVSQMRDEKRLSSGDLTALHAVLDDAWTTELGWKVIRIGLENAQRYRHEVAMLIKRIKSGEQEDVSLYCGNAGQLRWAQAQFDAGTITTKWMNELLSALDPAWCETLGWSTINLPVDEAIVYRDAVENLVARCADADNEAMTYRGNGGQIRFVQHLCDTGRLQPRRIGQLYGALDTEWRAAMEWSEIDTTLDIAMAFREAVQDLVRRVANGDEQAMRYKGNEGQLLFLTQLQNDRVIGQANPRQLWGTVEPEWAQVLDWHRLYRPRGSKAPDGTRVQPGWSNDPNLVDLSALRRILPEDVDTTTTSLPRLIMTALAPQRVRFARHRAIAPRTLEQVAAALRNGTTLIPTGVRILTTSTWFGDVDPSRLNNIQNYLEARRPAAELLKDLWVAHALGLVPLDLPRNNSMNAPKELRRVVAHALKEVRKKSTDVRASWSDQFSLDYWMSVETWSDGDKTKEGQIRFLGKLYESRRIAALDLGRLYTAIDPEWLQRLGWTRIGLPAAQAAAVRDAVAALVKRCTSGDAQALSFRGNAGQVRFMQTLRDAGTLTSTYLSPLFAALDRRWVATLDWTPINISLDDAVNLREAVHELARLAESGDARADRFRENRGQIRFIETLRDSGKLRSTHLGMTYSALDRAWCEALGWSAMNLPLEQASRYRAAVEQVVAEIAAGNADSQCYLGNAGQILFVERLRDEGTLTSFGIAQLHGVLDREWVQRLEWNGIELPLDEAIRYRTAVAELVDQYACGNDEARQYGDNAGQLRFVQKLVDDGLITSTRLSSLTTALDPNWMNRLGWSRIRLSLEQASYYHGEVRALVDRCIANDPTARDYLGNAGQIRFVQALTEKGRIRSRSLRDLYTTLESRWTDELGWNRLGLSLAETLAVRDEVNALAQRVASDDAQALDFMDDDGQLRFIMQLRASGKLSSVIPANFFSVLDPAWIKTLRWGQIGVPLDTALQYRAEVKRLIELLHAGHAESQHYTGDDGQLRFVARWADNGSTTAELGALYTALDRVWVDQLHWTKIDLSLNQARPYRDAVRSLVKRLAEHDPAAVEYIGDEGQIRFVTELTEAGHMTSGNMGALYAALESAWRTALQWRKIELPLDQVYVYRKQVLDLVEQLAQHDPRARNYTGRAGQIRFVTELIDAKQLTSSNLGQLFSALDPAWCAALDWRPLRLPLHQARVYRDAVRAVIGQLDEPNFDARGYSGVAGQLRLITELVESGRLRTTHPGQLFSALEPDWSNTLGWRLIGLPFERATACHDAVRALIQRMASGDTLAENYAGVAGQMRFASDFNASSQTALTTLDALASVVDDEWLTTLRWTSARLSINQAATFRDEVRQLAERVAAGDAKARGYAGVAGQIRFVTELQQAGSLTSTQLGSLFAVIEPEWSTTLDWKIIELPIQLAVEYRGAVQDLIEQIRAGDVNAARYSGIDGQIRFITELKQTRRLSATPRLRALFSALEPEWTSTLGWQPIGLPFDDVQAFRDAVSTLVHDVGNQDREAMQYIGNGGQIRFVDELVKNKKIQRAQLSALFSALEPNWRSTLRWTSVALSLDQALAYRDAVSELVARVDDSDPESAQYAGTAGQIRFVEQLHRAKRLTTTHLAGLFAALEPAWCSALNWRAIALSLAQAVLYRDAVHTLVQQLDDPNTGTSDYSGVAGQIRFVSQLREQGQLTATHLGSLITALEPAWCSSLDWHTIPLPLEQAIVCRDAVQTLVERVTRGDPETEIYKGVEGQIRFARRLQNAGQLTLNNLNVLVQLLDAGWSSILEWRSIWLPLEQASSYREAVSALVGRIADNDAQAAQYIGTNGQIRFVSELENEGLLKSPHLGSLFATLEPRWYTALNWQGIEVPLQDAQRYREAASKLVARLIDSDPEAQNYLHMAGQIRFVAKLLKSRQIVSRNLRGLYVALDEEWTTRLKWHQPKVSLAQAAAELRSIAAQLAEDTVGPRALVVDGTPVRAAIDDQGIVVDWFTPNGLPRRLQRFNGTIVGYRTSSGAGSSITIRLRAPLGYAVYSFASYVSAEDSPVEVTFTNGVPKSFRIRDDMGRPRTLAANNVLLNAEHASGYHMMRDGDFTNDLEVIDAGPRPDEIAEQQVVAQSLQALLLNRFGQAQAAQLLQVFATWDELTQDEGFDDDEAYAEINNRFGVDRETVLRFKRELAEMLVDAELHE